MASDRQSGGFRIGTEEAVDEVLREAKGVDLEVVNRAVGDFLAETMKNRQGLAFSSEAVEFICRGYKDIVVDILNNLDIQRNPDLLDDSNVFDGSTLFSGWKKIWYRAHKDEIDEIVRYCYNLRRDEKVSAVMQSEEVAAVRSTVVNKVILAFAAAVALFIAGDSGKDLKSMAIADLAAELAKRELESEDKVARRGIEELDEAAEAGTVVKKKPVLKKKKPGEKSDEEEDEIADEGDSTKPGFKKKMPLKKKRKLGIEANHGFDTIDEGIEKEKELKRRKLVKDIGDTSDLPNNIEIDPERSMVDQFREAIPVLAKNLQKRVDDCVAEMDPNDPRDAKTIGYLKGFNPWLYLKRVLVFYTDSPEILRKIMEMEMPAMAVRDIEDRGLAFRAQNVVILGYNIGSVQEMQKVIAHELQHILVQSAVLTTRVTSEGGAEHVSRNLAYEFLGDTAYEKLAFRYYIMDLFDAKTLNRFFAFDEGGDRKALLDEVFEGDEAQLEQMVEGFLQGTRSLEDVWREINNLLVIKSLKFKDYNPEQAKFTLVFLALNVKGGVLDVSMAQHLYGQYVAEFEGVLPGYMVEAFKARDWSKFQFYDDPLTQSEIESFGKSGDMGVINLGVAKRDGWEDRGPGQKDGGIGRGKCRDAEDRGPERVDDGWERLKQDVGGLYEEIKKIISELGDGFKELGKKLMEVIERLVQAFSEQPFLIFLLIGMSYWLYLILSLLRGGRLKEFFSFLPELCQDDLEESRPLRPNGFPRLSVFEANILEEIALQGGDRAFKQALYLRAVIPGVSTQNFGWTFSQGSNLAAAVEDFHGMFLAGILPPRGASAGTDDVKSALHHLDHARWIKRGRPTLGGRKVSTFVNSVSTYERRSRECETPKAIRIVEKKVKLRDGIVVTGYDHQALLDGGTDLDYECFDMETGNFYRARMRLSRRERRAILNDKNLELTPSAEFDECKLDIEMGPDEKYDGHILLRNGLYCVRVYNDASPFSGANYKLVPTPFYSGIIPLKYFQTDKFSVVRIDLATGRFTIRDHNTNQEIEFTDPKAIFKPGSMPVEIGDGAKRDYRSFLKYREGLFESLFEENERELTVSRSGYVRFEPRGMTHFLRRIPVHKSGDSFLRHGALRLFIDRESGKDCWYAIDGDRHLSYQRSRADFSPEDYAIHRTDRVFEGGTFIVQIVLKERKTGVGTKVLSFDIFDLPTEGFEETFRVVGAGEADYRVQNEVLPGDLDCGLLHDLYGQHGLALDRSPVPVKTSEVYFYHIYRGPAFLISKLRENRARFDVQRARGIGLVAWEKAPERRRKAVLPDWEDVPDWAESRAFVSGDDAKDIDWPTTLRLGGFVRASNGGANGAGNGVGGAGSFEMGDPAHVYVKKYDYRQPQKVYHLVLAAEALSMTDYMDELYETLFALATRKNRLRKVGIVVTNHKGNSREIISLRELNLGNIDKFFEKICDGGELVLAREQPHDRRIEMENKRSVRFRQGGSFNFLSEINHFEVKALEAIPFERIRERFPQVKKGFYRAIGFADLRQKGKVIRSKDYQVKQAPCGSIV